ncbi:LCP family protein [Planococcus liqunii]|uniref:LCP family protein n=1 Tax=Planococcus liqunii TaxID=3058394 RepID=UPI002616EFB8|nr:LCP family protein [Planococcus sp. N056]WKA49380.1 LCP family protein [Planococcus sp. N056]
MGRSTKIKKRRSTIVLLTLLIMASLLLFLAFHLMHEALSDKEASQATPEKDLETTYSETNVPETGELNVLLIGTDRRSDEYGLSDALLLANYNFKNNRLKLVSFMRDTYVDIPGYGMQKINAAHSFGGPELIRETLYENFGIAADHYASVDFNGFPHLFDLIIPGGIEVDIPYEMSHGIGMTLEPGIQTLNGGQLLGYVRFRHDKNSDYGRVERQQEVLSALKTQGINFNSLLNLPEIIGAFGTYIDTDLDKLTLLNIGKSLVQGDAEEVKTMRIPVADAFTEERKNAGEVLVIDLEANQRALHEFLESESQSIDVRK